MHERLEESVHLNSQKGLTFVELAIAMVIVGLLIIGTLAGKALIRSAEILSLIQDEHKYVSAVNLFKLKYGYLPGDYPQATTVWGTMPGSCGSSANFSTCTGTLNGDGNGYIQGPEVLLVWNQLALAGLIPGKYAGMQVNNCCGLTTWGAVEANLPKTALPRVYPTIWYEGDPAAQENQAAPYDTSGFFISTNNAGNVMVFGTPLALDGSGAGTASGGSSLYVADASTIDTKLDDGLPAEGNIQAMAVTEYVGQCTNTPSNYMDFPSYTYNFSNTSQAGCALAFFRIFE